MKKLFLLIVLIQNLISTSFSQSSIYVDFSSYKNTKKVVVKKDFGDVVNSFVEDFFSNVSNDIIPGIVVSEDYWKKAKQILSTGKNTLLDNNMDQSIGLLQKLQEKMFRGYISQIKCSYLTIDQNGKELRASGKLYLPKFGIIKGIIIANHYTIGSNRDATIENFCFEAVFATKGYAVLMADYIGYGLTKDKIHPYLHLQSTAQSVVDLALCVRGYLNSLNRDLASDEIILVGYSQGGAVTLGVQQLMEKEYASDFKIKHVYAGAGPYDIASTYDYCINKDETGIPCAIPMIVQGLNEGDNLELSMEYFFQKKILENYDEWINSKLYTVNSINILIGENRLTKILTQEAQDKTLEKTSIIYDSMVRNSIINWKPKSPVFLFHSTTDDMVPFINSKNLKKSFDDQGVEFVSDFSDYGSHMVAAVEFMKKVYEDLD